MAPVLLQSDGAPPLDLIQGDDLVQVFKDYRLGVAVTEKIVEDVSVNTDWFQTY